MNWVNNALAQALQNVNGLLVVGGGLWLYVGLRGVSRPVANIVAGSLLMAIGAFPYVQRLMRKH